MHLQWPVFIYLFFQGELCTAENNLSSGLALIAYPTKELLLGVTVTAANYAANYPANYPISFRGGRFQL